MLALEEIFIRSYDLKYLTVYWEVSSTTEDIGDYGLNIYRSDNPVYSDEADLIVSGLDLETEYEYDDYNISGLDVTDQWSYRNYFLEVENLTTHDKSTLYGPYHMELEPDPTAKYIIFQKSATTMRSRYGGRPVIVLKRRTNGQVCTDCFDDTLLRRTKENCPTCYDTSWVNGYWPSMQVQAMMNPTPRRAEVTLWGLFEPGDTILTLLNYPVIIPRDIIVDRNNRRWQVVQVRPVERGLYLISQQALLRLINKGDIAYTFPITWKGNLDDNNEDDGDENRWVI